VRALPPEKGGHTPAAAFTAYAREEDRERALAAGYQMHIAKPISSDELVSKLAQLSGLVFTFQPPAFVRNPSAVSEGTGYRPTLT
jgi:CheY-like chemotaxis protein